MAYNLEYTIRLTDNGEEEYGIAATKLPARAGIPGDVDAAKDLSETLIVGAGGTTGQLFETTETLTSLGTGQLVASFEAGEGWTDAE